MGNNIHSTAIVSSNAEIGSGVKIGPYSIVHAGVKVAENTTIGAYCELGVPSDLATSDTLLIGAESNIRSHSVFYIGSTFGEGLVTGHRVTVRENTYAGKAFQLGTKGDVQGHCQIGDLVKTHSNVHIGQKSEIGNYVWMFPDVLLTNDPNPPSEMLIGPKVGDFAVIASKATLLPGVSLGKECVIGAHSLVGIDVPDAMLAVGNPAKIMGPASILRMKDDPSQKAYPWSHRFKNGYPDEITQTWGK